jgi:phosphohistidine phosphatase
MRIYLVQHGEALAKDIDPARPLSDLGHADVAAVARLLARSVTGVFRIVHSGKPRAAQTADILAAHLAPGTSAETMYGLAPNDPVEPVAKELSAMTADIMLGGHMPFMGKLAARLVAGDEMLSVAAFVPGTVVCVEAGDEGDFSIAWMVGPTLARHNAD